MTDKATDVPVTMADSDLANRLCWGYSEKSKEEAAQLIARHRAASEKPASGEIVHPDLAGHVADAVRDACRSVVGRVVSFDDSAKIADAILQHVRTVNEAYLAALSTTSEAPARSGEGRSNGEVTQALLPVTQGDGELTLALIDSHGVSTDEPDAAEWATKFRAELASRGFIIARQSHSLPGDVGIREAIERVFEVHLSRWLRRSRGPIGQSPDNKRACAVYAGIGELKDELDAALTPSALSGDTSVPYPSGDRRYPPEHPLSPEKVIAAYRSGQQVPKSVFDLRPVTMDKGKAEKVFPSCRGEPSIRECVTEYYSNHFLSERARELTNAYFTALDRMRGMTE